MNTQKTNHILSLLFCGLIICCQTEKFSKKISDSETLFSQIPASKSNIVFNNTVVQDDDFNCIRYTYALIGGGVAIGDINNDGLDDIYFTSNQNSNKLYLNKGDFEFKDITDKAKVADAEGWSTGVNMIDINNDGWLDIYVCKSASLSNPEARKNKLFINQKDGTFREEAEKWGLAHEGFSIQSYFFDYDNDGDLDMYLVNHRIDFENTLRIEKKENKKFYPETSDHLFRNDGSFFTNVTVQSRIINGAWGLSASIGDFNNDGWNDIYVANDYIAPDILYINNHDGTFSDEIQNRLQHISYNSMGSDFADINNDFLPDLFVLEMSAEDHVRSKENMASMNTEGFKRIVNSGLHYPYMSNVLQLNNGNGSFSDIGQIAGIAKTDWSWAPLVADFDNDGYKDLIVTNGIERNFGNQDYARKIKENLDNNITMTIKEVVEMIPSEKIANYSYRNKGDFTFENTTSQWGFTENINSNGIAYADFDNDGDLDVVINNMSDVASLYRNNSTGNYINIKLNGDEKNRNAIGSTIKVFTKEKQQYQEHYVVRGFQSSMSQQLNFGLGDETEIGKIEVIWNNGKTSVLNNITANQTLNIDIKDAKNEPLPINEVNRNLIPINPEQLGLFYTHKENDQDDFAIQVLLPQKQSQQGPACSVGDINGDGLDDLFFGGAKNQESQLYIQNSNGTFKKQNQPNLINDMAFEDNGSLFFDADNDGDLDIYVSSGDYELNANDVLLQDRLYINDGKGNFQKSNRLPKMLSNTKTVKAFDYDADGDLDLFIGGLCVPKKYPLADTSYILENDKGTFKIKTEQVISGFSELGMIKDFVFSDYDNDGKKDLIVVGEWMPITVFKNMGKNFQKQEIDALNATSGWWNTISVFDVDNDGDDDYLLGNLGTNNKFHPSVEKPLHIYSDNFDGNTSYDMILSKEYKGKLVPVRGKECSTQQNAFVSKKMETYKKFATSTLIDIYGEETLGNSYHKTVTEFSSILLKNERNGNFTVQTLPNSAQLGPTMGFEFLDINKDGIQDVIGIGAIQEAEVETIRYDANIGYILIGTQNGELKPYKDLNFYNNKNAKSIKKLKIGAQNMFIIVNNNDGLTVFSEGK